MRRVAVFDFDGTLTTKDSLLQFILFAKGKKATVMGFLLFIPLFVLMFLRLLDHSRCKELLLSYFFKGMPKSELLRLGEAFAPRYKEIMRRETNDLLQKHMQDGDTLYIISAGLVEWVRPIALSVGVKNVLGTEMAVDNQGILTGRFATPNCFGQEKVNRLLEVEPQRDSYILYAYGDSGGDKEMLAFADYSKKFS